MLWTIESFEPQTKSPNLAIAIGTDSIITFLIHKKENIKWNEFHADDKRLFNIISIFFLEIKHENNALVEVIFLYVRSQLEEVARKRKKRVLICYWGWFGGVDCD